MPKPSGSRPVVGCADALTGLLEALRAAGNTNDPDVGEGVCVWCQHDVELCDEASGCIGWKCRAALAAFRERRPLREDQGLLRIVELHGPATRGGNDFQKRVAPELLDAIEAALLGSPAHQEGRRG